MQLQTVREACFFARPLGRIPTPIGPSVRPVFDGNANVWFGVDSQPLSPTHFGH